MLEGLTLQEFHAQEGLTVMVVDLVNRADVRMIQRRCSAGFALKTLQCLRVFGKLGREKLQGNMTAELEVFRLVNHSHASAPSLVRMR